MKALSRKCTAFLLSLTLLLTLAPTALASEALGDDLDLRSTTLNRGAELGEGTFWSNTFSDLRQENYVVYTPNTSVTPIVTYGDYTTATSTVSAAAKRLEEQGLRVVAGINGDYYDTLNGAPLGTVMTDGVLRVASASNYARPAGELSAEEILASSRTVMHGLGQLSGTSVLNCREGFDRYYARGARVFEVDLRMTSDGQVVLRHDWRGGWQEGISELSIPTRDAFLAAPLLERYTPMSFRDLLLLMEEYPDICIITDTKFTDAEVVTAQFTAMLNDAHKLGLSYLFDRMVIQVYSPLMFRVVDHLGHFPHYIYTFYAEGFNGTEEALRERLTFCRKNGIEGVTMWSWLWRPSYAAIAENSGVRCYVHTVNDREMAEALLQSGVSAVYTDYLVLHED